MTLPGGEARDMERFKLCNIHRGGDVQRRDGDRDREVRWYRGGVMGREWARGGKGRGISQYPQSSP